MTGSRQPNSNDASCSYSILLQVWTVNFKVFVCNAIWILLIMTINRHYMTSACFMTITNEFRIVQTLFYYVLL
jgi:hypothetical protein